MTRKARSTARRWSGFAVVGALAALVMTGAGCLQDSGRASESPYALAADAAQGESWVEAWETTGPPPVPTLDELQSALSLSAEQAEVVGAALATWQEEANARMAQVRSRSRDGSRGGGGHGMPGAPGEFEPPLLGFLETAVPVLEPAQVEALAELVPSKERPGGRGAGASERPRRPGGRGPGERGPRGHGPGFLGQVLRDLDLSSEQQTAVHEIVKASREAFHDVRRTFAEGEISAEQLRDRAKELRESLESGLRSTLSDDQFATLESAVEEHRTEVTERRLENLETSVQRRTEFLVRVLELTTDQASQVEAIVQGTVAERRTLLEGLRDGEIEIEDALYEGYQIAQRTDAAIRDVLTPDQVTVFDALKKLLPGRRGPRCP